MATFDLLLLLLDLVVVVVVIATWLFLSNNSDRWPLQCNIMLGQGEWWRRWQGSCEWRTTS